MYFLSVEKRPGFVGGAVPKRDLFAWLRMVNVQRMFNVPRPSGEKRGLNRVRTDLQVVYPHSSHDIVERVGIADELGGKCVD